MQYFLLDLLLEMGEFAEVLRLLAGWALPQGPTPDHAWSAALAHLHAKGLNLKSSKFRNAIVTGVKCCPTLFPLMTGAAHVQDEMDDFGRPEEQPALVITAAGSVSCLSHAPALTTSQVHAPVAALFASAWLRAIPG